MLIKMKYTFKQQQYKDQIKIVRKLHDIRCGVSYGIFEWGQSALTKKSGISIGWNTSQLTYLCMCVS